MSTPNGAKMEPKSGLFLGVKIIRVHCKTHRKAGIQAVPFLFKMQILFFYEKLVFSKPSVLPRREHHFWGFTPHIWMFFSCFFNTFFEVPFCTSNMAMLSFTCKLHTFCAVIHASAAWKNLKNHQKLLLKTSRNKTFFLVSFSRMCAAPTRELDFWWFFQGQKTGIFCFF